MAPPREPVSVDAALPAYKDGDCWVLNVTDIIPAPTSLHDVPWRECSTITVNLSPRYDSPDPSLAPMLDMSHAHPYMMAIINRSITVSATLRTILQEDINTGTMAIKVVFGEC